MNNSPGGITPDPHQDPLLNIIADLIIERYRLTGLLEEYGIDPKSGEKLKKQSKNVKKRIPLNMQKITKRLHKGVF